MCTSQKVPRLLVKIRETLVYTEIASTLLQLNLFSWNLSLNFLTLTLPPKVKLHCKLETFQWTLSGCRFFDLAITPPVCSFFLVLFCWPMWHHPIKQQRFIRHQFVHITAEHPCPRSPTEDDTPLCMPRDRNPKCLLNNEEDRKRGKLCCSSLTRFGAGSSLQMLCPYQILSLFLKRYLTYCPLPPQTCASFPSFPPYTLCLSNPSFPFLLFLNLP